MKDGEFLDGVIGVLAQLDVGVPVCKEGEVRRPVRLIKNKDKKSPVGKGRKYTSF